MHVQSALSQHCTASRPYPRSHRGLPAPAQQVAAAPWAVPPQKGPLRGASRGLAQGIDAPDKKKQKKTGIVLTAGLRAACHEDLCNPKAAPIAITDHAKMRSRAVRVSGALIPRWKAVNLRGIRRGAATMQLRLNRNHSVNATLAGLCTRHAV